MQKTKLGNFTVYYENREEYHSLKKDVFGTNSYEFETDNPAPVIIDAGANIGLSVLFFKKNYPGSKIIAIEPMPSNFKLLEANIFENNLRDVFTHELAISNGAHQITLHTNVAGDWDSTASVIEGNWTRDQRTAPITVPARPLPYFIDLALEQFHVQHIDLLKMDIEGAEQKILIHNKKYLMEKVKYINCEFHPHPEQNLNKLFKTLEEFNFKVVLYKNNKEVALDKAKAGLIVVEARNLGI